MPYLTLNWKTNIRVRITPKIIFSILKYVGYIIESHTINGSIGMYI
jgi:hypothetical protein